MVAIQFSKVIVIAVNTIFLIFGIACLAVGIVFKVGWEDVRDAFVDHSKDLDFNLEAAGDTLAIGAIVFGSFITIVSLLGCIGACCRNRVLLSIYAIIILIILIGEIVIVALVASKGSDAVDDLEEALLDSLEGYNENITDGKSKAFATIFSTMECCGITTDNTTLAANFRDVTWAYTKKGLKRTLPIQCCHDYDYEDKPKTEDFEGDKFKNCIEKPTKDNAYMTGCATKVEDFIDKYKDICIGVGVTIIVIEIVCVVLAFFLCCRHDDD